jgi:hypothetical protein
MSSEKANSENKKKLQTNTISKSQIDYSTNAFSNIKTLYSDYGYLSINQNDLSDENELVSFEKETGKYYGTILVSLLR